MARGFGLDWIVSTQSISYPAYEDPCALSVTRGRQHVQQSYTTEMAAAVTGTARREVTKRLAL